MSWWPQTKSRRALERFAKRPPAKVARELGYSGPAVTAVQVKMREALRQERTAEGVLERTRLLVEHISPDRHLTGEILLAVRAQARRHEPVHFDTDTLGWLET